MSRKIWIYQQWLIYPKYVRISITCKSFLAESLPFHMFYRGSERGKFSHPKGEPVYRVIWERKTIEWLRFSLNLGPSKVAQPGGATLMNSGMNRLLLDNSEEDLGSSEWWFAVKRKVNARIPNPEYSWKNLYVFDQYGILNGFTWGNGP